MLPESNALTSQKRPYIEPTLDRWKIALLGVLFTILLLSAMAWVV